MMEIIDQTTLEKLVADGALLVDVREEEELHQGGIDGYVHMPLSQFESYRDQIPNDRPIVFYCQAGRRSIAAAEQAEKWTPSKIYSLEGGFQNYHK